MEELQATLKMESPELVFDEVSAGAPLTQERSSFLRIFGSQVLGVWHFRRHAFGVIPWIAVNY